MLYSLQVLRPKYIESLQNRAMKPAISPSKNTQADMFRSELKQIIDLEHPLVKLADVVDWEHFDKIFGSSYSPDVGRPGNSTRLMVALNYLKYTHNFSDEAVLEIWVENPYWQYFSGMKFFTHKFPINSSSMTRWRKRIGETGAEELLKETLEAGLRIKAIKPFQLKKVNVDTTVQEKEIRFPTDARLYERARERLVKEAKKLGIQLRQSYKHKSKELLHQQSRYSHAHQHGRASGCVRQLKTYLGRVIRDIERRCPCPDESLKNLLETARRIFTQRREDKHKVYSVHEPTVSCISKGKAHKRYEFGCKVSVSATSKGGWLVGAKAFLGNPYDGRTLSASLSQIERLGVKPRSVYVDMGYRGHDYVGDIFVEVAKRRRGNLSKSLWGWMLRRSAIEASIGHLKREHRLVRNRLKGEEGDKVNVVLSAAGMNFRKLRQFLAAFLRLFWFFGVYCRKTASFGFAA